MSCLSKTVQAVADRHNGSSATPSLRPAHSLPAGLLRSYAGLERALRRGHLGERLRLAIAVTVAEINDAERCREESSRAACKAGLCEEEIALARRASGNNAQTDRLLSLVQAIVLQRGHLSEADMENLRESRLSEPVVVELLAEIALNIFKNYVSTVLASAPAHSTGGKAGALAAAVRS